MKSLMKILGLFISLELIVAPLVPNFSFISSHAFAAESCATGMTFDTTLNRCLTSAQAANVLNATMSCAAGDVECYKTNAQNAFQEKVNAGEAPERKANNGFVSTVGQAVAIAGPVSIAAFAMKGAKSNCLSPSFWAMVAGAGALVVGDNLANMQHKSRLKQIREEWGKIVNPEDAGGDKDKEREKSIEAQSQAFEMLARAEESMEKAANMKKMFFLAATLAYGASAAMAVMEIIKGRANKAALLASTCVNKPVAGPTVLIQGETESLFSYYSKSSEEPIFLRNQLKYNISQSQDMASLFANNEAINLTHSSPSIETYEALKSNFKEINKDSSSLAILKEVAMSMLTHISPIQPAIAEDKVVDTNAAKSFKEDDGKSGSALMGIGVGVGAGLAAGMLAKGVVAEKLTSPVGRAAFSGVMTAWSGIMAKHAAEQAKASKKRADLLRKMKEEFASASGAIYACKSEDRNDPGKPTCYCYTPENQRNSNRSNSQVCQNLWAGKSLNATDYNKLGSTSSKICINNQNQADATCACKATNTCMKVKVNGLSGINPGTMSMLSSSLAPVNGISDGSVDAANLDAAALENQAARMGALNKALEDSKGLEDYKKNKDKDSLALQNQLNSAAGGMSPSSMLGGSGSSFGMPSNPGQAALALEKELEGHGATSIRGAESINANSDSVTNENLEFGLTQDQLKAQETQIAEVMKEKLDYGNNDINPGSTTNIFKVLSNRYQRSGMRRLFDEKGTTQAEKPATTDISK